MDTFPKQQIQKCLRDTDVAAAITQFAASEKGEEQNNAELCMRALAASLTDPLDLKDPKGYAAYVAEEFAKDVDGEGLLADAAFDASRAGYHRKRVEDRLVNEALDARVMDERDWLDDQAEAYRDEEADRAYDERRIYGPGN